MKVSKHALERIKERNLNVNDLLDCIKRPGRQQIMPNGSIRNWHVKKNLCVVHRDGVVITCMRKEW